MATIDNLRTRLIDRILTSRNEKLLNAIDDIFDSTQEEDIIQLDSYQKEMLMMSDEDIKNGNVISQDELDSTDASWME